MKKFSGSSIGAWLLTNPVSSVGWYENLGKIAASGDNIQNIDTVQNELTTGKCLSMNKISHTPHNFELNAVSCSERRRAICRLKTPAVVAPSKPPQFPCLKKTTSTRRKRDTEKLSYENSK